MYITNSEIYWSRDTIGSDTKFWYTFAKIRVLLKLVIIVVLKKKNRREKIRHENYAYFNDYVARYVKTKRKKKLLIKKNVVYKSTKYVYLCPWRSFHKLYFKLFSFIFICLKQITVPICVCRRNEVNSLNKKKSFVINLKIV